MILFHFHIIHTKQMLNGFQIVRLKEGTNASANVSPTLRKTLIDLRYPEKMPASVPRKLNQFCQYNHFSPIFNWRNKISNN